ncbi:FG-GAP-like repeat-containing protein [Dokdonia pacifica]|uniref:Por secretion system C-terminal sorting domain-containing protein n=1 Tax=Dokdonia pacifica TaxID=1627892 RepID=A0A239CYZ4_9FLAO|nr:FG-GAP-like repeat-containing protein [Dokdonia pacifica]SNS25330.1 Por secretion system C-terminal sorting domain-containing protein [Dokdonia pacifica]
MGKQLLFFIGIICCYNSYAQVYFENQSSSLGADIQFEGYILGAGISFYDYNDDGLDDITLAAANGGDHIFLKNEGGYFVADDLGISNSGEQAKQVIWVDYDNDGDADFFSASDQSKCRLYRNDGDGVYVEVSEESGIPGTVYDFFGASWGDYNNDSFLDVFLSIRDPNQIDYNLLYKNNGDGTFTDVTEEAGLDLTGFLSFCSAFFDYDKDGYQDIYIANDKFFTPNLLYRNNGDGTFESVGEATGADLYMGAMSTTIDDYNNDGWLDIYVTNFYPPEDDTGVVGNAFLRNNGDGTFTNVAEENGTRFDSIGWGAVFLDADNDTDHDLYVSGNISDQSEFLEAAFYENQGDDTFLIPDTAGFVGDDGSSYSNALGDVDNDGYPEIIVMNNGFEEIYLWKNETPQDNNWIKVKLEGTESNRMGIGSWIRIGVNGEEQYHYTLCGEGYLGQNSAYEFFGLGDATTIDFIEVTWLSGQVDYYENIEANASLTIIEGEELLSVAETTITNDFNVFPNPVDANGILFFKSKNPIEGDLTLYDTTGKEVVSSSIHGDTGQLQVHDVSSGFYILKVETQNSIESLKVIIK